MARSTHIQSLHVFVELQLPVASEAGEDSQVSDLSTILREEG